MRRSIASDLEGKKEREKGRNPFPKRIILRSGRLPNRPLHCVRPPASFHQQLLPRLPRFAFLFLGAPSRHFRFEAQFGLAGASASGGALAQVGFFEGEAARFGIGEVGGGRGGKVGGGGAGTRGRRRGRHRCRDRVFRVGSCSRGNRSIGQCSAWMLRSLVACWDCKRARGVAFGRGICRRGDSDGSWILRVLQCDVACLIQVHHHGIVSIYVGDGRIGLRSGQRQGGGGGDQLRRVVVIVHVCVANVFRRMFVILK